MDIKEFTSAVTTALLGTYTLLEAEQQGGVLYMEVQAVDGRRYYVSLKVSSPYNETVVQKAVETIRMIPHD
jgi:hypothetical protein